MVPTRRLDLKILLSRTDLRPAVGDTDRLNAQIQQTSFLATVVPDQENSVTSVMFLVLKDTPSILRREASAI